MLTLVGLNHRSAPVEIRERLALSDEDARRALDELREDDAVSEAFVLSTCNRVEFLVRGPGDGAAAIDRFIETAYGFDKEALDRHTYRVRGNDAVRHLFRVTSGLDSMILGEPQITGQVKQGYRRAREAQTTGPILERLIQSALAAAKRVRSETDIARHPVSIASAAVTLARQIFGELGGRSALLVGAGKMAALVATARL